MTAGKCPFSSVMATGTCGCRHAREVVRRGGVEHDCAEPAALDVCTTLVERLKAVGLPALGNEDDLTRTPKSVYDRILAGGLQGLRVTRDPNDDAPETADVWSTVESARDRYGGMDAIPADDVVPAMEAFRIARRPPRGRPRR